MQKARICFLSLILALVGLFSASAQNVVPPLVIRGATLIDGTGKPAQENVTILVDEGQIKEIGKDVQVPKGAEVVDGTGKFVVPGLMDARVQIGSSPANRTLRAEVGLEQRIRNLNALLAAGVTTARLIQGDLSEQRFYQQWAAQEALASPRLITSGPTFTAEEGIPIQEYSVRAQQMMMNETREVKDEKQAREKAREVAHAEVDTFEVVYDAGPPNRPAHELSEDALIAISEEAHGHELKLYCAVGTSKEAGNAVANGAGVIEGVWEEVLGDDVLAEMKKKNVIYLPALTEQGDLINRIDPAALKAYLADPLVQQSLSVVLKKSLDTEGGLLGRIRKGLNSQPELRAVLEKQQQRALENVRRAHAAGVTIALGTGSGKTLIFPGPAVHRELELLVQAGLSPLEALSAATRHTAECLGKAEELGTIEVGKSADLVVLAADPLKDIRNTEKIFFVVRNGRTIRKEDLDFR